MDDPIDAGSIAGALVGSRGFWRIEALAETVSTNSEVMRRAEAGEPEGLALFADHQTAGRGRRGNRWLAPPGTALLGSMLLRPAAPPAQWPRLTLAAAVAVCEAVEALVPLTARIKWPNDVLVDGRKLAGVLIESRLGAKHRAVVVGIGLNVGMASFPADLRQPATSLRLATAHPPARAALASALLDSLHRTARLAFHGWEELRACFHQRDAFRGVRLHAESAAGACDGTGAGIDGDGCFLITRADGRTEALRDAHSLTPLAAR